MSLYDEIFLSSEAVRLFSEKNTLAQMLLVEAALAKAQAANGILTPKHAQCIARCCHPEQLNIEQLKADIRLGGNAAIPLVKQLTEIVRASDPEAAKFVHLGATSQDIIDTATVLQIRSLMGRFDNQLKQLEDLLVQLTRRHRNTVMAGRTLLQQAKPITFGLKTAGWLESISRARARLTNAGKRILVLQLAGATGSGGPLVSEAIQRDMARTLGLKPAPSRHTHRDHLAEWAAALGILTGSLGKIAKDVSLLMQTEIAEVLEGAEPGKGGSSAMPHKRNPVTCVAILANAYRTPFLVASMLNTMVQENERAAGAWHAEWPVLTELMLLTAGALERGIDLIKHLEVDEMRMRENLEQTKGLIYAEAVTLALAAKMGKAAAHQWMENACKMAVAQHKHLKTTLQEQGVDLPPDVLEALFQPENAIGHSLETIDNILKKYADAI